MGISNYCNSTLEDTLIEESDLAFHHTFHAIALGLCFVFSCYSTLVSLYLIIAHALHYSQPREQKQIIRILFLVPIYGWISYLSLLFYEDTIYFQVIRDCYEAIAIASFFTLLCNYIAPTTHDQKDFFRSQVPKNWVMPINWMQPCTGGIDKGPFRRARNGLTWFNLMWVGVFQYCFVHVVLTFASLISQAAGRYCDMSLSPAFGHLWISLLDAAGVIIAMYCIIQFYYQIREDIAAQKPLMKLISIKLVIFFSFWQNLIISFASTRVKTTSTLAFNDIKVGIPSTLLCIEMAIFATLHIWAFPWRQSYSLKGKGALTSAGDGFAGAQPHYHGGPLGIYAYWDAFNVWDMIKATARGFRWLFVGIRHRREDISYQHGPDSVYSSTKLGPVGVGGPMPLQRDEHMSQETIARQRSQDESSLRPPPDFSAAGGDLGYQGNKAFYGGELPAAPIPSYENPFGDGSSSYHAGSMNPTPRKEPDNPFDDPRAGLLNKPGGPGNRPYGPGGRDHSPAGY